MSESADEVLKEELEEKTDYDCMEERQDSVSPTSSPPMSSTTPTPHRDIEEDKDKGRKWRTKKGSPVQSSTRVVIKRTRDDPSNEARAEPVDMGQFPDVLCSLKDLTTFGGTAFIDVPLTEGTEEDDMQQVNQNPSSHSDEDDLLADALYIMRQSVSLDCDYYSLGEDSWMDDIQPFPLSIPLLSDSSSLAQTGPSPPISQSVNDPFDMQQLSAYLPYSEYYDI